MFVFFKQGSTYQKKHCRIYEYDLRERGWAKQILPFSVANDDKDHVNT